VDDETTSCTVPETKQEVIDSKSWAWLASGNLKKEREGFLMAAQSENRQTKAT